MAITIRDLPENPQSGIMLYCIICGAEHSACKGDYFLGDSDYVFTCCDTPMILVRKTIAYDTIQE